MQPHFPCICDEKHQQINIWSLHLPYAIIMRATPEQEKKIIFASINKEREENIREMEIKKIVNHMKPKRETERWVRERGRSSKRSQRKNADVARSANTQQRFINTRRGKSLARERKSSLCRVSFWISRQRQKWVIRLFPCFTCEKKSKLNRGECHSRDLWH